MSGDLSAQAAAFVHLQRVRELAADARRPKIDRDALLALLALVERLAHVLRLYLQTPGDEIGDVDVEAAELLAEIEAAFFAEREDALKG
jgi:hypothetical protein